MDLISKSGPTLDMSSDWWLFYRMLAEKCGWNPKGTGKPDHLSEKDQWDGNYDYSDGQIVYDDDAKALAQALDRALAEPAAASIIKSLLDTWWNNMQEATSDAELAGLSEKQKKAMRAIARKPTFSTELTRELIDLCRQGEFRIE
jgi:hypothetical protein